MGSWSKPIRKVIFTLDIGNYQPAIKALTFPLMQAYASKIGAEFYPITERKFPEWPIVYEKLQIFELGRGIPVLGKVMRDQYFSLNPEPQLTVPPDWNIFFDADALISPEMFDVTAHLDKSTVLFNGKDMSGVRFKPDQYFLRDGRWIGACNWFACASDWCLDLWRPLDDLTLEEAVANINITIQEHNSGMFKDHHLIDDYTLSRNIAKYGLKHDTLMDICGRMGIRNQMGGGVNPWLFHVYSCSEAEKINKMLEHLSKPQDQGGWALMNAQQVMEFKAKWGIK